MRVVATPGRLDVEVQSQLLRVAGDGTLPAVGAAVTLVVRPESLGISRGGMGLAGTIALPLLAEAAVLHGGDPVFAGPAVGIVWGVLKGEAEDRALVVIQVSDPRHYGWIKVGGVDLFTQHRLDVVTGMPLGGHADIRSPRATFADWPRRENHLHAREGDWRTGRSGLTVYYLGVPDTIPEFTTEAALEQYLATPPSPRR